VRIREYPGGVCLLDEAWMMVGGFFAFDPNENFSWTNESTAFHFIETPNDGGKRSLAYSLKDNMGIMGVSNMEARMRCLLHGSIGDEPTLPDKLYRAQRKLP
jgi:hypothetical protein